MRESCSWEGNTYAKYIFNPHRSWRDGSGSPTGTRIVDKAYAAKRLLDSIYGIRNFLWYAIHGTLTGNQAIVVWAIKRPEEKPVLNPQSGSFDFDDSFSSIADESKALHDDISDALNATNVQYAKIFSRVLRGYEGAEDLKKHNDPMVVVILDAATTGRLGVTFYCELQKDEYIKRILQWHVDAAWPLTSFKKASWRELSGLMSFSMKGPHRSLTLSTVLVARLIGAARAINASRKM